MSPFKLVSLVLVCLMPGCGDDGVGASGSVVGGPCASTDACAAGSFCVTGGDFPDGTCTVSCRSDPECPEGTACVDKQGGVCLLACLYPQDCRAGYTCKGEDRAFGGGDALVCSD